MIDYLWTTFDYFLAISEKDESASPFFRKRQTCPSWFLKAALKTKVYISYIYLYPILITENSPR